MIKIKKTKIKVGDWVYNSVRRTVSLVDCQANADYANTDTTEPRFKVTGLNIEGLPR